jgi:hypothetical protein
MIVWLTVGRSSERAAVRQGKFLQTGKNITPGCLANARHCQEFTHCVPRASDKRTDTTAHRLLVAGLNQPVKGIETHAPFGAGLMTPPSAGPKVSTLWIGDLRSAT